MADSYRKAFDDAVKELGGLLEEREGIEARAHQLDTRIFTLKELIEGLAIMCEVDVAKTHPYLFTENLQPTPGFTNAVRQVVQSGKFFRAPVDIRDELQRRGFKLEKYKNPLASIHTILKRLYEQGEIDAVVEEKKFLYGMMPDRENKASKKAGKRKRSLN
jgi:hypothetical protein